MPTTINPSGQTITQYNVQTGGASNLLNNVSPSSTSGVPVISQGSSSQPVFGTATVAGGGTGQVTLTNHGVLVGAATSAITQLAAGSAGQVLQSGGGSADPAYSTATYPATASGTGTILRADGTNWSATTSTYPNTNAINTLLYASSTNVISALATANNGVHITGTTGIPSVLANGTTGQVLTATTGSPPSWANNAASSITITGDSGGALTGAAFTFTGGTTGLTFAGSGSTETLGGTLIVGNGGTGRATLTNHGVLVGAAASAITQLAAGTAGQVLQSGGASADPAYSTATYPTTAGSTNNILQSDGTNFVSSSFSGNSTLIQTQTASNSGTLTFTTGITGYRYYRIEFLTIIPVTDSVNFRMEMSTNAGSTWLAATGYAYALQGLNSSGTTSNVVSGGTSIALLNAATSGGIKNGARGYNGIMNIVIPSSGWSFGLLQCNYADGGTNLVNVTGMAGNTVASVNGFRFSMSSGNISSGIIAIFGIN